MLSPFIRLLHVPMEKWKRPYEVSGPGDHDSGVSLLQAMGNVKVANASALLAGKEIGASVPQP